jgi:nicotinamide/nicotinate riboside kinase
MRTPTPLSQTKSKNKKKKVSLNHRSRLTAPPPQPFVDSKEDQNSVGKCTVPDSAIDAAKKRVAAWLEPGQPGHALISSLSSSSSSSKSNPNSNSNSSSTASSPPVTDGSTAGLNICILDGFLLFGQEPPLERVTNELLDIKIFLTVSREKATKRREARDGYVTLEGFWTDPPGYVDKIVWPNYAESHAWLFENGDVEGWLDGGVLGEKGILALPGVVGGGSKGDGGDAARVLDVDMEVVFNWAVETLMRQLEEFTRKK